MKHHAQLAISFLSLLTGFIGLNVMEFTGNAAPGTLAAYDLLA